MNRQQLEQKWPQAQFERWQQEGTFSRAMTYERYLDFRAAQQAESEQQLRELTERYGKPPSEQPPELSAEDERDLQAAWDNTHAARAQQKATDQPERIAA